MDSDLVQPKLTRISPKNCSRSVSVSQTRRRLSPPVEEKLAAVGREKILVTSFNICTYLGERFRKKRVRDAIAFIAAELDKGNKVAVRIDRTDHQDALMQTKVRRLLHPQLQSSIVFEVHIDLLRIRVHVYRGGHNSCFICEGVFENAQMHYFIRLIAPLFQPIYLKPSHNAVGLASLVNSLGAHINVIGVSVDQFVLQQIYTLLNLDRRNKLSITYVRLQRCERQRFRAALVQWLNANNDGQTKFCDFSLLYAQGLTPLLAEIQKNFFAANKKCSFVVSLNLFSTKADHLPEPFNVRNSIDEQLELRPLDLGLDHLKCYLLIRRPITQMELHLDGLEFGKMNTINCHEFIKRSGTTFYETLDHDENDAG